MLAGYSVPTGMKSASKLVKRPHGQCGCMRPELGEVWKFHVPSFTFWTDLELKNMSKEVSAQNVSTMKRKISKTCITLTNTKNPAMVGFQ